uniref:Anaphase-promoting complex subunit 4 WD40 domain-containing protein n=1 Tax=Leptocylindrus danicus TaxID=163516 RepID=A0A7S2P0E3_9STRA|mmetsp:Transcript_19951/g.29706  ORF Transcript_19951/g.29706 Transcript_19951/m.29706 type:complete len:660 (+) Transcript_19951:210-2189(+)|eukprot:CAMPEP_0116015652 /NCGR_PEP_ID=MMETSP0321-20121206/6974_1 /TAXON_ID=163516 /ORGANISM="Leptocylindrus danicus var. danicus, Strain B650" /LENGTH=659 /DNA_ID=CAMNT_0003485483 /DNA_START=101 /DNA_END=2080 /DNA_ORIENTATION=+
MSRYPGPPPPLRRPDEDVTNERYRVVHDSSPATRNVVRILRDRSLGRNYFAWRSESVTCHEPLTNELGHYGETYSIARSRGDYLKLGENTVSTICVAFAPDGSTLASTHGDHTVKITCCATGRLIQSMEGHPRTPWTVKFHPSDSGICASGCLGHQVRVWDTKEGVCLKMVRLYSAVISLSFHPRGGLLSMASGNGLYIWNYEKRDSPHPEFMHDHSLRCVSFTPGGDRIIVGGFVKRAHSRDKDTHSLRLWDFDYEAAVNQSSPSDNENLNNSTENQMLSNCRIFLHRALLYNDGGFDVSPCGKFLIACSEWWLPHEDHNIIDLVRAREEEIRVQEMEAQRHSMGALSLEQPATPVQAEVEPEQPENNEDEMDEQQDDMFAPTTPPRNVINDFPRSPPPPPSAGRHRMEYAISGYSELDGAEGNLSRSGWVEGEPRNGRFGSPPNPPQPRRELYSSSEAVNEMSRDTAVRMAFSLIGDGISDDNHLSVARDIAIGVSIRGAQGDHYRRLGVEQHSSWLSVHEYGSLGKYIPHVVLLSLDVEGGTLGQLIDSYPLEETRASGVTCVKFSPSNDYCLLGYGVREDEDLAGNRPPHQVTSLFRIKGGIKHVVSLMSLYDDVNIARFHPDSGHGLVYGTKQGRVRILSPKPWTSPLSSYHGD